MSLDTQATTARRMSYMALSLSLSFSLVACTTICTINGYLSFLLLNAYRSKMLYMPISTNSNCELSTLQKSKPNDLNVLIPANNMLIRNKISIKRMDLRLSAMGVEKWTKNLLPNGGAYIMVLYHALGIQSPCENGNGIKYFAFRSTPLHHPLTYGEPGSPRDGTIHKEKSSNQKKHYPHHHMAGQPTPPAKHTTPPQK